MTRRDMIIIATLANAGLIAALFMLAVNSDDDKPSDSVEVNQVVVENKPIEAPREVEMLASTSMPVEVPLQTPSQLTNPNDEVDNALKELASQNPAQTVIIDDDNQYIETEDDAPQTSDQPVAVTAPVEPTAPAASAAKYVEITVKRGDSLDKIARANGTTIAALKETNQLKNDRLKIGQVLRVPSGSAAAASSEKKSKAKAKESSENSSIAQGEEQYHTVKRGDNPWKIAKQYHIKVDDLLKLNDLDEEKARNLKIGDKVRVR